MLPKKILLYPKTNTIWKIIFFERKNNMEDVNGDKGLNRTWLEEDPIEIVAQLYLDISS